MNREEICDYISQRDVCDESCLYFDVCPESTRHPSSCIVSDNLSKMFDAYYNLYFCDDGARGIDEEIKRQLLLNAKHVSINDSPDSRKGYLDSLLKSRPIIYGKETTMTKNVDEIKITVNTLGDEE